MLTLGFFSWLGSLANRITKLFVIDIDASGNITADYFIGNGSQLTGISGGNSSWNQTYANTLYYGISNPLSFIILQQFQVIS